MKITPTMVIDTEVAEPDDLPLVIEILAEAATWLKERGIDQDYITALYQREISPLS